MLFSTFQLVPLLHQFFMTFRPPALSLFRHFRAIKCRQMAHCMKQHQQQQLLFYFLSPHNPAGTLSPVRPSPVATCTFKDIASPPLPPAWYVACVSLTLQQPHGRHPGPVGGGGEGGRGCGDPRRHASGGHQGKDLEKSGVFFERIDWLQESLGKVEEAQIAPVSCCVGLLICQ